MQFIFPGHKIVVDFSSACPKPGGDWQPASLFYVQNNFNLLLLRQGKESALWLLDEDFRLYNNEAKSMLDLLDGSQPPDDASVDETLLRLEVRGLLLHHAGYHELALQALSKVCSAGKLRDAESFSALVGSAYQLGQVSDVLPLVETVLDRGDLLSPEQAANSKAWLGRLCADRGDFARAHRLLVEAVAGSPALPEWVAGCLDHCSRQDASSGFSDPPNLLKQEMAEFGRAALDFLAGRPCGWKPGRYPTITVARHWVRWTVKVIHLEPGDAAATALLHKGGISPKFLQAALRGRDGVGEACFAQSSDVPFASDPAISLRVKEVAATVLLGGKPILCPFTGERDLVRDSINLHTFLHRKDGRSCIVFSDPDISLAPADSAWFFPDLGIALTIGWNMRPENELATTLQRVLGNIESVSAYLAAPERTIMVSEEGMGHIGHYIWNVLSGWDQLFRLIDVQKIGLLTSYATGHFFGGVTELYEKEIRPAGRVLRLNHREDAYAAMLAHRGLSLVLRDRNVTQNLAERVEAWCRKHVSDTFLRARAAFRREADPLIMMTLRLENRAWVEQEGGFVNVIQSLVAEYPRLGVIIDGLNALPPGTQTFVPMSLKDEQAMAERIIAACPGVRFVNAIGCSPAESVLWCTAMDAFAAPIGAGLAKSRWLANKPGVGFSNRTFLEVGHFEGYLYSHFREAPSVMRYVARERVSDVDGGNHGLVGRANFSMDWRALLMELRSILATIMAAPPEAAMSQATA